MPAHEHQYATRHPRRRMRFPDRGKGKANRAGGADDEGADEADRVLGTRHDGARRIAWPEVTVLVPVGSTRTVEFIADNPGDWTFHCHITHHIMNQMGHQIPNMIDLERGDFNKRALKFLPGYMTMGGMNIKVRTDVASNDQDPGWYPQPPGMFATVADRERMKRDLGFLPDATPAKGDASHQHQHG